MAMRVAGTTFSSALFFAAGVYGAPEVEPHPGMLRYPDIGAEKIAFVYANDVWIVDRQGGEASPLASPPGQEQFPRFSPDGSTIAFVGNYDGNRDLYTIPIQGGVPTRVTHHPTAEMLCDWTPDGRLLFFASGLGGLSRQTQLFTVDADGGLPEQLPVPYGAAGAISPDGEWLAYTPHTRDHRTWKRYRGGMATDIWLFNLNTNESRKVTEWEGTDSLPMWHGSTLYYVSDSGEESRLNIWSYDLESDDHEQLTHYTDRDVKWPSIGPGDEEQGEIIFQNGPALFVIDLSSHDIRDVEVTIPGARPTLRPRQIEGADFIHAWNISSTGKRAAVEARGDIWTLPAEHGSPRNLTRTSGIAERDPSWSPDGRWIAYFSDETGEYELYITQSDGKGETRQVTDGSETFYYNPLWSPDSKKIAFTDKAAQLHLHDVETGETKILDKDPWGNRLNVNWSHDSRWLTYARSDEGKPSTSIHLYDTTSGEGHRVTNGMFSDSAPTFDRKGDYLYFSSTRHFQPSYSNLDTTFIYDESEVLVAVPLLEEVDSPYLEESDEEEWDEDEPEEEDPEEEDEESDGDDSEDDDDESDDGDDSEDDDSDDDDDPDDDDDSDDEGDDDEAAAEPVSPIAGVWEGTLNGLSAMGAPEDSATFSMTITVRDDGTMSGSMTAMGESHDFDEITFNEDTGEFVASTTAEGMTSTLRGTLQGEKMSGEWEIPDAGASGTWEATRTSTGAGDDEDDDKKKDKAREVVEIDLENFEARAMQIPVPHGNFGRLAVNHRNQLIYVRRSSSGSGIHLFDLDDDKKQEKSVASGAGNFRISSDGKKLLVMRGRGSTIQDASAGSSGEAVVTSPMWASIKPREEWRQVFNDAWRIQRDFFYLENMHGVDWPAVREHYEAMLDDAVTREDISYIIGEMIAELNVGHAYYWGGDGESEPSMNVGMLGADFELDNGAYRITRIYRGAPWDLDARSPLGEQGLDVSEGDYLLAVNGVPLDTGKDPWAPFVGLAGRTITITVSEKPELDDEARQAVVRTIGSENQVRYRHWIEQKRAYVEEQSGGRVGYIYVPDTGINGQNDLVRQYFGQIDKDALIIDERWNGGGQIPTRFIEMLNRPVTNYWARRDSKDWKWPPDAHHGPKCMLINGLAGSGGDMFPWLFRHNDLGPLIGTRTWGGLVGISGNPRLIDGGYTAVPTFGFYETDSTWGVEGHGVDPDIEVIDDPAEMVDGGDPQLDKAIEVMLAAIEESPYVAPQRPEPPDRSRMGIRDEDK